MCSAGSHCRAPISACPLRSRTYAAHYPVRLRGTALTLNRRRCLDSALTANIAAVVLVVPP
jgi:hypothetical protein